MPCKRRGGGSVRGYDDDGREEKKEQKEERVSQVRNENTTIKGEDARTMMAPAWALNPLADFLPDPDVDVISAFPSE